MRLTRKGGNRAEIDDLALVSHGGQPINDSPSDAGGRGATAAAGP